MKPLPTMRSHALGSTPPAKKKRAKRRREEHREQERFVAWARLRGLRVVHCPNELVGQVSKGRAAELKRLGVSAGVPDVLIFDRRCCVALEFKGPKGGPSPSQRGWLDWLGQLGWRVVVVTTCEQAVAVCAEAGL